MKTFAKQLKAAVSADVQVDLRAMKVLNGIEAVMTKLTQLREFVSGIFK